MEKGEDSMQVAGGAAPMPMSVSRAVLAPPTRPGVWVTTGGDGGGDGGEGGGGAVL